MQVLTSFLILALFSVTAFASDTSYLEEALNSPNIDVAVMSQQQLKSEEQKINQIIEKAGKRNSYLPQLLETRFNVIVTKFFTDGYLKEESFYKWKFDYKKLIKIAKDNDDKSNSFKSWKEKYNSLFSKLFDDMKDNPPSCAKPGALAAGKQCCRGGLKDSYSIRNNSCKAPAVSCSNNSECCSGLCLKTASNEAGFCFKTKVCRKVFSLGEKCSRRGDLCAGGSCVKTSITGNQYQCLNCKRNFDKLGPKDKCCPGFYRSKVKNKCIKITPLHSQMDVKSFLNKVFDFIMPSAMAASDPFSLVNSPAECADAFAGNESMMQACIEAVRNRNQGSSDSSGDSESETSDAGDDQSQSETTSEVAVEPGSDYDRCQKAMQANGFTPEQIEVSCETAPKTVNPPEVVAGNVLTEQQLAEIDAKIEQCKEDHAEGSDERTACLEAVETEKQGLLELAQNGAINSQQYYDSYNIPNVTSKTYSDVKKCEFNSYNDVWRDTPRAIRNSEIFTRAFEYVWGNQGSDDYWKNTEGKSIFAQANSIAVKLRQKRSKYITELQEIDRKMTCKCLAILGVGNFSSEKQAFFQNGCREERDQLRAQLGEGLIEGSGQSNIDGSSNRDEEGKDKVEQAKIEEMDKGAIGLSYQALLIEYLKARSEIVMAKFVDTEPEEKQLLELSQFIDSTNFREVHKDRVTDGRVFNVSEIAHTEVLYGWGIEEKCNFFCHLMNTFVNVASLGGLISESDLKNIWTVAGVGLGGVVGGAITNSIIDTAIDESHEGDINTVGRRSLPPQVDALETAWHYDESDDIFAVPEFIDVQQVNKKCVSRRWYGCKKRFSGWLRFYVGPRHRSAHCEVEGRASSCVKSGYILEKEQSNNSLLPNYYLLDPTKPLFVADEKVSLNVMPGTNSTLAEMINNGNRSALQFLKREVTNVGTRTIDGQLYWKKGKSGYDDGFDPDNECLNNYFDLNPDISEDEKSRIIAAHNSETGEGLSLNEAETIRNCVQNLTENLEASAAAADVSGKWPIAFDPFIESLKRGYFYPRASNGTILKEKVFSEDHAKAIINGAKKYATCFTLKDCGATLEGRSENDLGFAALFESEEEAAQFAQYTYDIHYVWSHISSNNFMGYPLANMSSYFSEMERALRTIRENTITSLNNTYQVADLYQSNQDQLISEYSALGEQAGLGTRSQNIQFRDPFIDLFGQLDFQSNVNSEAFQNSIITGEQEGKFNEAEVRALNSGLNSLVRSRNVKAEEDELKDAINNLNQQDKEFLKDRSKELELASNPLNSFSVKGSKPGSGSSGVGKIKSALSSLSDQIKNLKNRFNDDEGGSSFEYTPSSRSFSGLGGAGVSSSPSRGTSAKYRADHGLSSSEVKRLLADAKRRADLKKVYASDSIFSIVTKAYQRNYGLVLEATDAPVIEVKSDKRTKLGVKETNELKTLLDQRAK